MPPAESVSTWLDRLKAGDEAAIQPLWERYWCRLVALARKKLQGAPKRAADEEDVALSAFDSFCRRAEQGRFPQLNDRNNLWRLLVVITTRKAYKLIRDEGRAIRGDVLRPGSGISPTESSLEQVLSREPTPEFAASMAEECRRLLDNLGEEKLRRIALLKMEGYLDREVAEKLDCSAKTVERKLQRIRSIWQKEVCP